jgi:hypothetical protein
MFITRPVAQVMGLEINESRFAGTSQNAVIDNLTKSNLERS